MMKRVIFSWIGATGALLTPQTALASNGLESPDIGVVQLGRGGAWVAKADDPLAVFMNPAAMSFQANGVHLGAHLMIGRGCFTRIDENGQPISPGAAIPAPGEENGPDAAQCATNVFPNPQLAAVFRPMDRLAIGLGVFAPHAVGGVDWGESVSYDFLGTERTQPAPGRYLLVSQDSILLFPTVSVSYAVIPDELSIGAGFTWGIANASLQTFTESTSPRAEDDFSRDVKATLSATDLFIPGFILGANWRATKFLDLGATFRWSDAIDSRTSLKLESGYWLGGGTKNEEPCTPSLPNCNLTEVDDAGSFRLPIPASAKLGVRYHHPRAGSPHPDWSVRRDYVRDSLSEDLFDVEVNLTWAHNSMVDRVAIQFDPGIPVVGTPGTVPQDGDIPHNWRDVLGIRFGTDVNILPNFVAVRGGGFFEAKGQDDEYLNLDFHMGWKAGVSAGSTVRLGPIDASIAYQHTFYGTLDNRGAGRIRALSGDLSTGSRSLQTVNGGSLTAQLDELALSGTFRF
jgi:long-chain fatty acid transport protein